MTNKFGVFILSHGRPDNIFTLKTLLNCNYTGPYYFVVDDEDPTVERYRTKYGAERVLVFNKKEMADRIDEANNFDNRKVIVHARNVCFDFARELGLTHFLQLDDDYTSFKFRFANKKGYGEIKDFDRVVRVFLRFLDETPTLSIAFSQGGDHIGGFSVTKMKRKCMNSFFCRTDRPFQFVGSINEDVNTYVTLGSRGGLFFTFTSVQLDQRQTQTQGGGMTESYLALGTYVKSFSTVLMAPSSVRVANIKGRTNNRIHHQVKWRNAVPVIIRERYKRCPA